MREHRPTVHQPVLPREVIRYLDLQPGQIVVDGTVGAGGHSQQIQQKIGPEGTLVGLDRDPMMLGIAKQRLSSSNSRLRQASYAELQEILQDEGLPHADRILLDLGYSSDQLRDESRGFGFESDGPLDLRFDTSIGKPAWKLIQQLSDTELEDILKQYGEERFSRSIAKHLVARRSTNPIRTAADLANAVVESVGKRTGRQSRRHPATRVFQALRIAVNNELDQLKTALNETLYRALSNGGRVVIISFHSLEDRLVKDAFRNQQRWQNLITKPITASAAEQRINPRARTAKLRAARKL